MKNLLNKCDHSLDFSRWSAEIPKSMLCVIELYIFILKGQRKR